VSGPKVGEIWSSGGGKQTRMVIQVDVLDGPSGVSRRVSWGDGGSYRYFPPKVAKGRKRAEAWPPAGWVKE